MRRKGHPSFPSAMTCCFFSSLKTLLMPTEPIRAPVGVNVPGLPMAGFQLTLHGRIWVTTEVRVDDLRFLKFFRFSRHTGRIKKSLDIENGHLFIFECFDHRSQIRPQMQSNYVGGLLSVGYRTVSAG